MNKVTAAPTADPKTIKANVAKWRQLHGLDPKPRRTVFTNNPRFAPRGDRRSS